MKKVVDLPLGAVQVELFYEHGLKDEDGKEASGQWDPDALAIYVNTNQTEKEQLDTLLHECMHAIAAHTGVEDPEREVSTYAFLLVQMLSEYITLPK